MLKPTGLQESTAWEVVAAGGGAETVEAEPREAGLLFSAVKAGS